jgi:hypothetical protein
MRSAANVSKELRRASATGANPQLPKPLHFSQERNRSNIILVKICTPDANVSSTPIFLPLHHQANSYLSMGRNRLDFDGLTFFKSEAV